ncbi:MAG: GtrA family protein [Synergistaceae bacterium]|nr:GtrA family protein [Synergistaceae bacterium]
MDKQTLKSLILYGIFGVLTTILNIFIYWLVTRIFYVPVVPATIIAWVIAVLFAYYTNRKYVFHSNINSISGIISEAGEFFICRLATGILDVIIMYIFVDVLNFNDVIIKTISNILVIILNYIASKLFIFKGEK